MVDSGVFIGVPSGQRVHLQSIISSQGFGARVGSTYLQNHKTFLLTVKNNPVAIAGAVTAHVRAKFFGEAGLERFTITHSVDLR